MIVEGCWRFPLVKPFRFTSRLLRICINVWTDGIFPQVYKIETQKMSSTIREIWWGTSCFTIIIPHLPLCPLPVRSSWNDKQHDMRRHNFCVVGVLFLYLTYWHEKVWQFRLKQSLFRLILDFAIGVKRFCSNLLFLVSTWAYCCGKVPSDALSRRETSLSYRCVLSSQRSNRNLSDYGMRNWFCSIITSLQVLTNSSKRKQEPTHR